MLVSTSSRVDAVISDIIGHANVCTFECSVPSYCVHAHDSVIVQHEATCGQETRPLARLLPDEDQLRPTLMTPNHALHASLSTQDMGMELRHHHMDEMELLDAFNPRSR